ncbi:MAG: 3-oxoacyl-[acyl-carrier-protein] reductase [Clostridiales Family XIII bacterium]|nr:3-oxoacyl-[acyl-carrier-protein] reductase [Clostridiales Family XIII bacterium]
MSENTDTQGAKLLSGKVAVVTGGSRGIGRAVCKAFAVSGADVLFTYVNNISAAEETLALLEAEGVRAEALKGDVSDSEFAKKVAAAAKDRFGGVDILVNNAGVTKDGLLMRMKPDDFDRVIQTNLSGTFFMLTAMTPIMMKARKGRVINLSSVAGVHGNAGQANYSASKAGVIGLTKSAAKELAPRNITVNAIAPGLIETDMAAALTEVQKEKTIAQIGLGRLGRAEEVAALAVFLASDKAAYITGQVICIDGGITM